MNQNTIKAGYFHDNGNGDTARACGTLLDRIAQKYLWRAKSKPVGLSMHEREKLVAGGAMKFPDPLPEVPTFVGRSRKCRSAMFAMMQARALARRELQMPTQMRLPHAEAARRINVSLPAYRRALYDVKAELKQRAEKAERMAA